MAISRDVIFTQLYSRCEDFVPDSDIVYIANRGSIEERGTHVERLIANSRVDFVDIAQELESEFHWRTPEGPANVVSLRGSLQLQRFWRHWGRTNVYLDITALRHHTWMPLVRAAIDNGIELRVVYVEPSDYAFSGNPTEGDIYDLSERTLGIRPIPGFISLSRNNDFCFVPMLGFEGPRAAHLVEEVKPSAENVLPIIGVPGFRLEYPFSAYIGNRLALQDTGLWQHVYYAQANCPFTTLSLLETLWERRGRPPFKIAPIGTKPHALAAMLFVMRDLRQRELVYDHPIRKAKRTKGKQRLLVYNVSGFLN